MFKHKPALLLALTLALSVVITACGGSSTGSTTSAPNKTDEAAATAPTTREYDTDKGKITIPTKPQRIVTDYYGGELLTVDANVIGVEPTAFKNPFIKDKLAEHKTVDVGTPLNMEKILELNPDLIVVMYDDNYDALSKIAPTVHIPYGTAKNIRETVNLFGDLTGNTEQAKQFLADYDKEAAAGREKLKGVVDANTTVGLYELTDKNALWIFGDNAGRGGQSVYDALQLKMPAKIAKDAQTTQLSLEALPEYDADYMFLTFYDPEGKSEALNKLKKSPVWSSLPAAKKNHIFYNDYDTFYRYDPIATKAQIPLFVDMILNSQPAK